LHSQLINVQLYRKTPHEGNRVDETKTMTEIANMLVARQDSSDNALANFQYYYYEPSMAAAIIFVILFSVTTALHMVQMSTTKTWFMIPFVIGGFCKLTDEPPRKKWRSGL
jgi:hypothetical protein